MSLRVQPGMVYGATMCAPAVSRVSSLGDRSLLALPVAFATLCLSLAATFDGDTGPELCAFRRCTGGYCPGCGGSRAAYALIRGDLAGSWAAHPWIPLLFAQAMIAIGLFIRGGRHRLRQLVLPLLVFNLVLGVTIWIVRLSTGAIPIPFA